MKDKADIIFLQETYIAHPRWRAVFSHTRVKEGLDCQLRVCEQDKLAPCAILKGLMQGQPFIFCK